MYLSQSEVLGFIGQALSHSSIFYPPFMFYSETESHEGVRVGLASLELFLVQPPESWISRTCDPVLLQIFPPILFNPPFVSSLLRFHNGMR